VRAQVIDAWKAVLAKRPHRFEALLNLGVALAADERIDDTRSTWQHAHELDPKHPKLLLNLAQFEGVVGDIDASVRWLTLAGLDVDSSLRGLGALALRELRVERGWELFARADAKFAKLDADLAYQLAHDTSLALNTEQANALEGSAHVMWARAHATGGDATAAVRSYRQAKRCLNLELNPNAPPRWHTNLRLELAAALCLNGKPDDARQELAGVVQSACDLVRLPEWAGQALLRANLLGGGQQ
jgi:tetratricopeptide (TPR) repeat protein